MRIESAENLSQLLNADNSMISKLGMAFTRYDMILWVHHINHWKIYARYQVKTSSWPTTEHMAIALRWPPLYNCNCKSLTRREQATKPPRGSAKEWDSVIHYPLQLRSANADYEERSWATRQPRQYQASSLYISRTAARWPDTLTAGWQLRKSPDWGFRT
jgi:hypothetical protein